jgi:hypothetical protein
VGFFAGLMAQGIEFAPSTTVAITELPMVQLDSPTKRVESVAYPDEVPSVRMRLPENER